MKIRGFEIISDYQTQGINLPRRATAEAAGYDFESAEDSTVPSIWTLHKKGIAPKPVLVKTGIKAYIPKNEYLELNNRSSNPLKHFLLLATGVGVIDSDYYNNEANEGHIMFQFLNFGYEDVMIKKGDRIGQGIFKSFLLTDDDQIGKKRSGGFGSSGKN